MSPSCMCVLTPDTFYYLFFGTSTTWSAMAGICEVCSFSSDGESLAIAGLDGEVKIWDSTSGNLKQRFNPSSVGSEIRALGWSRPVKEVSVSVCIIYVCSEVCVYALCM